MFQTRMKQDHFPLKVTRIYVKILLLVLSYLHDECKVVHTDIKPENILMGFEKTFSFSTSEDEERLSQHPGRCFRIALSI